MNITFKICFLRSWETGVVVDICAFFLEDSAAAVVVGEENI